MKIIRAGLLAVLIASLPGMVAAQEFPTKPATLVIAFPTGGSTDLIGRYIADGLSKAWGQPVVPQNLPGAGSAIGSAHVAKAAPDGYTMLLVSASYSTNAATQTDLPFDPVKDLAPVAIAAAGQFALTASSKVKARTVAEFIEEAKTREVFYATTGVGSSTHFGAELFNSVAGLTMKPVHYKGAGESFSDLVSARVDVYFGTITQVLPAVQAGQLHVLGVTNDTRAAVLPDVPTLKEAGVEGAGVGGQWYGIFVPGSTPIEIQEKINKSINELMSRPESAEFLEKQGAFPDLKSVAETTALVHSEMERWRKIAAERGIVAQ